MKRKIARIIDHVNAQYRTIEVSEASILKKSEDCVELLEAAFEEMKALVADFQFKEESEEIQFFKETKPQLFCKLIYCKKVFDIENMRPNGSDTVQKEYLLSELDQLTVYFNKNIDFYKYYRSGCTHFDRYYFLRGKPDIQINVESFYFERDPLFSAPCDFKVAKILANELLRIYLNEELMKFEQPQQGLSMSFPKTKKTWTRNKTDLVELLYAVCETDCFNLGRTNLKRLTAYFENVFNIDLGNIYHTYIEIKDRANRTQFLDELKEKLLAKMDAEDQKR